MMHTEKYILNTLKTIALEVLNKKLNGNSPQWDLTISSVIIDEEIYQAIAKIILGGSKEGELCQFVNDEREFVYWKLKINWKYEKPAFIFFNESEIDIILKQE